MTLLTIGRAVLGIVGCLLAGALAVVVLGSFLPRLPVVGFFGSFVSGQYPLHAAVGAVVGVVAGVGLLALGATRTGVVVTVVAALAVVGTLTVLGAQRSTARAEGVAVDWGLTLTALDQSGAAPDATVAYQPGLQLDLYLPPGPGPHPVMVWVFGGSWVRGTTADRARANRWYADQGLAVAAVQYRLPADPALPGSTLGEAQRHDVARAVAWVRGPGTAYGLDPGAVLLGGQSAGATLALSTAAALTRVPGASLPGGPVTPPPVATVAFYPVIDMRQIAPNLQQAVFGGPTGQHQGLTRAASPGDLVDPRLPPTLLVLGKADNFIRADLVRAFDAELRAAGVPGRLLQVPYADHVFDHPYGSPGAQVARPAVLAFAREHTRSDVDPSGR